MKFLIATIFVVLAIFVSSCSTHYDDNYYERANRASEKSLNNLDKE
jgi:hypothetical protein